MFKIRGKSFLVHQAISHTVVMLIIRQLIANTITKPTFLYSLLIGPEYYKPENWHIYGFYIVCSLMALLSLAIHFINASAFSRIKIFSRPEDNTPEFNRSQISNLVATMTVSSAMLFSFAAKDSIYMNVMIPVSILCVLITAILYKEKPAIDSQVELKENVEERLSVNPLIKMKVDSESELIEKNTSISALWTEIPERKEPKKKAPVIYNPALNLASIPERIFAAFVDFLFVIILFSIAGVFIILISFIIVDPSQKLSSDQIDAGVSKIIYPVGIIFIFLIPWLYNALFESSRKGATPGKMLFHIKVTDYSGERITFWRASIRILFKSFMSLISVLVIPLYAFVRAALDDNRQTLHDIVVKSIVIKSEIRNPKSNMDNTNTWF